MAKHIKLEPNYDALYEQFAREAKLKSETLLSDLPEMYATDSALVKQWQVDILRTVHHILNSLNICTQCTVRANDIVRLRELIDTCTVTINQKADDLALELNQEHTDDEACEEPGEDDLTTKDHRQFFQHGKLAFTLTEEKDGNFGVVYGSGGAIILSKTFPTVEAAVKGWMDAQQFWPSCWFISDHGNAHLMNLWEEEKSNG